MKGISAVVAGTIILLLIVIGVIPLIMLYINTAQNVYSTYKFSVSMSEFKELEEVKANLSNNVLTIANAGAVPVDLTYIVLKDESGKCDIVISIYDIVNSSRDAVISYSDMILDHNQGITRLDVNGYLKINISRLGLSNVTGVCNIATSRGNIIEVKKIVAVMAQKATAVIITPVTLNVVTLANRTDIAVNDEQVIPPTPTNMGTGMARTTLDGKYITALVRYAHIASKVLGTYTVKIRGGRPDSSDYSVYFNNIFIGYSPEWSRDREGPRRYNILITSCLPLTLTVYKSDEIIPGILNISTKLYEETNEAYVFNVDVCYRMKILNYIPYNDRLVLYYDADHDGVFDELVNEDALGYWWLYANQLVSVSSGYKYVEGYIILNGTADEIDIYVDASSLGFDDIIQGSYEPYIFSADVDGNGYPEFLFITEDASYSRFSGYVYNDIYDNNFIDDWSTKKFLINLTGYTINGEDTAMVQIAIRTYFHDNLGGDTDEVEYTDRTIFGIYLVDTTTGKIVNSREWNYQELDDLEDTWPPNRNFVMLTATLVVPSQGTYYIAIGFQDPYSDFIIDEYTPWPCSSQGSDDGDFVIALEIAGIAYYARP